MDRVIISAPAPFPLSGSTQLTIRRRNAGLLDFNARAPRQQKAHRMRITSNPIPALFAGAQEIEEPFHFDNDENMPGSRVIEQYAERISFRHFVHPPKGTSVWLKEFTATLEEWRADPGRIMAATDGSLPRGGGKGRAVFVLGKTAERRGVPGTSSYEVEAQALEDLFRFLQTEEVKGHVTVLVDNAAAAKAVFDTSIKEGQFIAIRAMSNLRAWILQILQ